MTDVDFFKKKLKTMTDFDNFRKMDITMKNVEYEKIRPYVLDLQKMMDKMVKSQGIHLDEFTVQKEMDNAKLI